MLAPNQGVRIAFDGRFEALVGSQNQRTSDVPVERIRSKADRHVQEEKLFGLADPARLEVGLQPANDLDHSTGARSIKADDERVVIPATAYVFAPESSVDETPQIRSQAPSLNIVEPVQAGRLQKANRVGAPVTLGGGQPYLEAGYGPRAREQPGLTAAQLLPA